MTVRATGLLCTGTAFFDGTRRDLTDLCLIMGLLTEYTYNVSTRFTAICLLSNVTTITGLTANYVYLDVLTLMDVAIRVMRIANGILITRIRRRN